MKARQFLIGSLLLFISQVSAAQACFPVKKVYAYFQPVTAGTMSKAEAGNRQPKGNYLLYITSKSAGVQLNNIWINGNLQHADLQEVTSPVIMTATTNNKVTLVPSTRQKTYKLLFTSLNSDASTSLLPKKYAAHPVVMELQYRKKKKFISIDSITQLDVMAMY